MTDTPASFVDHRDELRNRTIKSMIAVGIGTVVAFVFYEQILAILTRPYELAVDTELVFFRPT